MNPGYEVSSRNQDGKIVYRKKQQMLKFNSSFSDHYLYLSLKCIWSSRGSSRSYPKVTKSDFKVNILLINRKHCRYYPPDSTPSVISEETKQKKKQSHVQRLVIVISFKKKMNEITKTMKKMMKSVTCIDVRIADTS